jgi:hypothetical protein
MPDGSNIGAANIRLNINLDETGHTALGWDEADDEWVIPLIRRKMEQGYVFHAVRMVNRRGQEPTTREVRLRRVEQIGPTRRVLIHDEEAQKLFNEGRIGLHVEPADAGEFVFDRGRRITDPREAVREDTIAARPMRGG